MKWKLSDNVKNFLKGLLKKEKLFLILLIGVLLIVINLPTKSKKTDTESNEKSETGDNTETAMNSTLYVEELEKKLKDALSKTANVGKVDVYITLSNEGKSILYTQKNTTLNKISESDSAGGSRITEDSQIEESVLYEEQGDTKSPYVVEDEMPKIQGAIIIAQGADDAKVVSDVTQAASALLGIAVNKIIVLKMEDIS